MTVARGIVKLIGLTYLAASLAMVFYGLYGGKAGHSIIEFSPFAIGVCVVAACLAMFAMTLTFVQESDAVHGTFEWIERRKQNFGRWLARVAFAALVAGVFTAITSAMTVSRIATCLDGQKTWEPAVISKEASRHVKRGHCHDYAHARLASGEAEICFDHAKWLSSDFRPEGIKCAQIGDEVVVELNRSVLGTTATVVSLATPRKSC